MGDVFQRVRNRVRVVVHRIDAPDVAGAVVVGVADAVDGRVAQRHVGRCHRVFAHFRAQNVFAILVLAGTHVAEDCQRFLCRAVAERRVGARRAEVAAVFRHVVGILAVDVGVAGRDEILGHQVQLLEVIAGKIQVALAVLLPAETEPLDAVDDGVDVFLLFPGRVGVVEAQMAHALVVARHAEVQADRLGVADVQVAVRLGREAGDDRCQAVAPVGAGGQVRFDDRAQEIRAGRGGGRRHINFIVAHEKVLCIDGVAPFYRMPKGTCAALRGL